MTLTLRDIEMSDLEEYICLNHPAREFHKFNAPYFHKESLEQLTNKVKKWEMRLKSGKKKILKNSQLIVNSDDNELIGEVNWYWKSKETQWMEIGIVIFNEKYWGR
jgi:putative hydrolase of HD superfamily